MLMHHPGLQKPHWEPFPAARRLWTGWKPARWEPMPSMVVMVAPSHMQRAWRQALMGLWAASPVRGSKTEETTVQAPQPPSPQPTLVPWRCRVSRR